MIVRRFRYRMILILLLMVSFKYIAKAQCDPRTDPNCEDPFPEDIPIDGGALALLAGGAALGYNMLKKKKED